SLPAKRLGGIMAGGPAANYDYRGWRIRRHAGLSVLNPNYRIFRECEAITNFDGPAWQTIERRCARNLAVAKAEFSMVPRATDCVPDQQSLAKRTAIMRARSANREELVATPHE